MKVLLFGAGENAKRFLRYSPAAGKLEVTGIVDNDSSKWGHLFEQRYTIEAPAELKAKEWERIVVTSAAYDSILNQLVIEYGIEKEKVVRASNFVVPANANLGSICLDCDYNACYDVDDLMPDRIIPGNEMEEFYFKNRHKVISKWWHYFEVYETYFHKYIESDVRILEIGVYKGGSLQMWKNYFGAKATIVGIDINKNCKAYEEDRIHICIGSQADKDFLVSVSEQWGPFDIVLDDGSHEMEHQIITFETLFPLLKEGGVYLCEDCHSSYSSRYGGGYKKKGTFIEYSKNFVDYVNGQFVDLEERDKLPHYADDIKACHYYDSMVVVEKKCRGYSFFTEFGEE